MYFEMYLFSPLCVYVCTCISSKLKHKDKLKFSMKRVATFPRIEEDVVPYGVKVIDGREEPDSMNQ